MFILGFNLPCGKSVRRTDGKVERPPRVIGIGIGWSRTEFTRVMKDQGQSPEKEKMVSYDRFTN